MTGDDVPSPAEPGSVEVVAGLAPEERLELRTVEWRMRQAGWLGRSGYQAWLRDWTALTGSLSRYPGSPDDYLDDLFAREGLARLLDVCSPRLRSRLAGPVDVVDQAFRSATDPDLDAVLERLLTFERAVPWYARSGAGFWWHRVPHTGPLAHLLRAAAAADRAEDLRWRSFAEGSR